MTGFCDLEILKCGAVRSSSPVDPRRAADLPRTQQPYHREQQSEAAISMADVRPPPRHREQRSDTATSMTRVQPPPRHREQRSDTAISFRPRTLMHFAETAALALLVLAGSAIVPPAAMARSAPVECQAITPTQVTALFTKWNDALATKDPHKVVATYAPDASLLPTVANGPLIGRAAIETYFEHFVKQSPQGKIDTSKIWIGCNVASDIGLYTFTVDGDTPGTRKQIHARFTFIYAPEHGHWLIVHHHSSVQPEPAQ
jgi:uncharacterized protein (TIGR02246 family)